MNPGARHVRGVPAYADIESIPDDVDLAVLAVPADEVAGVVEACRRKRVRGPGRRLRRLRRDRARGARRRARSWSPRPARRACAWSAPTASASSTPTPRCGSTPAWRRWSPAAAGSGSSPSPGSLGVALLERARSRNLGLSTFVSAGNRADVSGNDLLQYWATDPATEVVLLHLESFGNPRKFARLARSVGRTKPVVAVKSGRHVKVTPRAGRHLGRRAGAVGGRAVRLGRGDPGRDRGADVRRRHAAGPPAAAGRRSGWRSSATPPRSACWSPTPSSSRGWSWPTRSRSTSAPTARPEDFRAALQAAVDDDGVDAVVAVFLPPLMAGSAGVRPGAARGRRGRRRSRSSRASCRPRASRRELAVLDEDGMPARGSVPSYSTPERAVISLAKVAEYARWRRRPVGELPELPDVDEAAGPAIVRDGPGRRARRAATSPTTS